MTTPITYNLITNVNFKFEIKRAPNLTYWAQDFILPSVSIDAPNLPMPLRDFQLPGTKPIFDNLNINFLVDEDLANYIEIYSWLIDAAKTENPNLWYSDATLHILTANMNPKLSIKFFNLHPTLLSELPFSTGDPDTAAIQCTANFAYTHFEIVGHDTRFSESTKT